MGAAGGIEYYTGLVFGLGGQCYQDIRDIINGRNVSEVSECRYF